MTVKAQDSNGSGKATSGKGGQSQGRGQGNAGGWPSATGNKSGGNRSNNSPRNK